MVSEEQLLEWERLCQTTNGDDFYLQDGKDADDTLKYVVEAAHAFPHLIAEVRRYHLLQQTFKEYQKTFASTCETLVQTRREADWLARILGKSDVCARAVAGEDPDTFSCDDYADKEKCAKCCRNLARRAVQND